MFTAEDKAAILVEALPYIQQFYLISSSSMARPSSLNTAAMP